MFTQCYSKLTAVAVRPHRKPRSGGIKLNENVYLQMRVLAFYAPLSCFIEEIGIIGRCCLHQDQKILLYCIFNMLSTEQQLPGNNACQATKESHLFSLQPQYCASSCYLRRFHAELTYFPRTAVVIASPAHPQQISQGLPYTKHPYVLCMK